MIREKKNSGPRQTSLSVVILSVLFLIGAGVFVVQFNFNPAILQGDAFLPAKEMDTASSPPSLNESFAPLPDGITPLTPVEIFEPGTLSDKINGKAELYLSAGFIRLTSQRFTVEHAAGLWIEAFVYDMGDNQNGFSVFSSQRREDAESLELTRHAYGTQNALFLLQDRYYVELIASESSEQAASPLKMMAETFIRNTPAEAATVSETDLFPKEDLVTDSVALIASDAFGYEGFDKIYTAEYSFGDVWLIAYYSHRQTSEEAEALAAAYTEFLVTFGGKAVETNVRVDSVRLIEILDTYEIIFSHGPYLAGVRDAATIEEAEKLAIKLYNRIKEADHGS